MEIKIGEVKLTAEYAGGAPPETDIYIYIDVLGDFPGGVKPVPKVLASQLKAAIEALEKTCWRP